MESFGWAWGSSLWCVKKLCFSIFWGVVQSFFWLEGFLWGFVGFFYIFLRQRVTKRNGIGLVCWQHFWKVCGNRSIMREVSYVSAK